MTIITPEEIEEIQNYICENIEGKISTESIAKKYFVSRMALHFNFKRMTGITLGKYIRDKKFARAKEYLEKGKSCGWVSDVMGYSCYKTFLDAYKNYYGVIPSKHKKGAGT